MNATTPPSMGSGLEQSDPFRDSEIPIQDNITPEEADIDTVDPDPLDDEDDPSNQDLPHLG